MTNRIKYSYASILWFSLFMYIAPLQKGEIVFRVILGLVVLILTILISKWIWDSVIQTERITFLLWMINSIGLFHLMLIFIYIVIEPSSLLFFGGVLGLLFYSIVINYLKRKV